MIKFLRYGIPIIGALIAALMWAAIIYNVLYIAEHRLVQYNPINNQDQVANVLAGKALAYHGILFAEWSYQLREYGFVRAGRWCSLYRSLPLNFMGGHKNDIRRGH